MDDEKLFSRFMQDLGVTPISRRPQGKRSQEQQPREILNQPTDEEIDPEAEDALFLESMVDLGLASPQPSKAEPATANNEESLSAEQEELIQQISDQYGSDQYDEDYDSEDTLFLDTMEFLFDAPDKDTPPEKPRVVQRARHLKTPKSGHWKPEETLDLHGKTLDEALRSLERFVANARGNHLSIVLVVTGKGLHSEDGRGVLKDAVESWLRSQDEKTIRAFREAPRDLGGRGAYLLHLR